MSNTMSNPWSWKLVRILTIFCPWSFKLIHKSSTHLVRMHEHSVASESRAPTLLNTNCLVWGGSIGLRNDVTLKMTPRSKATIWRTVPKRGEVACHMKSVECHNYVQSGQVWNFAIVLLLSVQLHLYPVFAIAPVSLHLTLQCHVLCLPTSSSIDF